MSFWDDLSSTASQAVKDAQPDIQSYATDWFKKTVLGQSTPVQQAPIVPAPMLQPPTQAVANFAAANSKTILILVVVAVGSFFMFKKGK